MGSAAGGGRNLGMGRTRVPRATATSVSNGINR